jgi:hypothetical protein
MVGGSPQSRHDGRELMTTIRKLLEEITALIRKLPEAQKAEIRRALIRNSRASVRHLNISLEQREDTRKQVEIVRARMKAAKVIH